MSADTLGEQRKGLRVNDLAQRNGSIFGGPVAPKEGQRRCLRRLQDRGEPGTRREYLQAIEKKGIIRASK